MMKKYANYTSDEFMTDLYFIDWIYRPTEEADLFFTQLAEEYPDLRSEMYRAAGYLRKIKVRKPDLGSVDIEIEWNRFLHTVNRTIHTQPTPRNTRRRLYRWSIAASIAILLTSLTYLLTRDLNYMSVNYEQVLADLREEKAFDNKNITLYIDDDKTILLPFDQVDIRYSENELSITGDGDTHPINYTISADNLNKIIVPKGKKAAVSLNDGSVVWLNSMSAFLFPSHFTNEKREVYIVGEAYFEIAHDKEKPFITKTKKADIKVLGTKFNVSAYHDDCEFSVTLLQGKVAVEDEKSATSVILQPNHRYSQKNNEKGQITEVDAKDYICWRDNLMNVESEPLYVMFKRLSRHYDVDIEYKGDRSTYLRCNGKLSLTSSIEPVLKTIETTAPVKITKRGSKYIVELK